MNSERSPQLRKIEVACRVVTYGVAVAILFGGFSVDRLSAYRCEEMKALRTAKEATADEVRVINREFDRLTTECERLEQSIAGLKSRLANAPQESQFNARLAEAAAAANLRIEAFRPGQRLETQALKELDVSIACRGTYEAHCDFLQQLRTLPRVCPVAAMKIASTDDHGSELQSEIQIRLIYGDATAVTGDIPAEGSVQ